MDGPLTRPLLHRLPPARLARAPLLLGVLVWLFMRVVIGFPQSVGALYGGTVIIAAVAAVVALVESRRHGDALLLGNLGVSGRMVMLLGAIPPLLLEVVVGPAMRGMRGLLEPLA